MSGIVDKLNPIFNRSGKVIAWREGAHIIAHPVNKYVAFITKDAIYNYQKICIGFVTRGYIRDVSGRAVGYMKGATGLPIPPLSALPDPNIPSYKPMIPTITVTPTPPLPSSDWSRLSWAQFLKGADLDEANGPKLFF